MMPALTRENKPEQMCANVRRYANVVIVCEWRFAGFSTALPSRLIEQLETV